MTIKISPDLRQFYFLDSMVQAFQRLVPDTFSGHIVYFDYIDPADLEIYLERIRQSARQHLERDLWEALYVEGVTHPTQN